MQHTRFKARACHVPSTHEHQHGHTYRGVVLDVPDVPHHASDGGVGVRPQRAPVALGLPDVHHVALDLLVDEVALGRAPERGRGVREDRLHTAARTRRVSASTTEPSAPRVEV